ncbi:terminase small subunit protein [Rhizobium leguminosarum]|uniref:terminase small subunit-like protein n=1 Tax=Rhizobium leguminosarum TaxID=384 RepID=UPI001C98DEDF|nr:terminase small subunit protein [Rhizobium leguminosarum]MBY5374211.1 terminase small subunit protein [Rhizobium leguminosarum]
MTGRPTKFTHSLADSICERIADGESLRSICRDDAMPAKSTVLAWLADDDKTAFRTKYAQAREIQADGFVDEMVEIADDGSNDWMEKNFGEETRWVENGEVLRRSQLRISTRQWIAEKLKPKKYGAKVELEHGVTGEVSQLLEAINGKTRGLPSGS